MVQANHNSKVLIRHILKLAENIFQEIKTIVPPEWLKSDITVAQLRVLLVLFAEGPSRMSSIATSLDIAISTATGIVDKLVNKKLVIRNDDPEDRRLVICTLSDHGTKLMSQLWLLGQSQIEKLLHGLTEEQLNKAAEVAQFLLDNVKVKNTNTD